MRSVSLFSGCGGLDLGLLRAGFEVVLANDNDPHCAATYHTNFPETPFHAGSVMDLAHNEDLVRRVSNGQARPGAVDLLAGGPPCPPFSKSRFYRKEKPRALDDPVAQATIGGYLALLQMLQPRAFLLENVWGLAYDVHQQALQEILERAAAEGYRCSWRILNAADYGVPQIRQRLFIVGMRDASFVFPEPTHAEKPVIDLFSGPRKRWVTAGEAIGDLDTPENEDDKGHFAGGQFHDLLRRIPPGENYLYFSERGEGGKEAPQFRWRSRYWSFLLKLSPDLPAWTIQARRSNNMGPFHWKNRILRIQEIKRLQTFPDDWQLAGTVEQQWRQIGNAVPTLLAEHLGWALAEQLRTSPSTQEGARDLPSALAS